MIIKSILTGKSIEIAFDIKAPQENKIMRRRRLEAEYLARLSVNGLNKPAEIYVTWEENQR